MRSTPNEIKGLSDKFDSLVLEIESCKDPQTRFEALQTMQVLINEIERVVFSLNHDPRETQKQDSDELVELIREINDPL